MRISVIDSHTGGEPTRVVLHGGIPVEGADMAARRDDFEDRFDHLRSGVVNEPRGSEVVVGALLTPAVNEGSVAGVIFFNNVGYLGMCGHGTIGVVETLRHLGQPAGAIYLDTPAGTVRAVLLPSGEVQIGNVPSYLYRRDVAVEVPGLGTVTGDIAYGGNWFYIVHRPRFEIAVEGAKELSEITLRIRAALEVNGIYGKDDAVIDHVEIEGPASVEGAHSKNFVMCPGGAYDRSPCGTGTSAKMACLFARGELAEGEWFTQESTTGSTFRGSVRPLDPGPSSGPEGVGQVEAKEKVGPMVLPTLIGRAYITGESTLIFNDDDPIRWGLAT